SVPTKAKSTRSAVNKLHDKKKSIVTQNQLECIVDSSGNDSEDSDALWSQLAKVSQVEVNRNLVETDEGYSCDRNNSSTKCSNQNDTRPKFEMENKNLREAVMAESNRTTAKLSDSEQNSRVKISKGSNRTPANYYDSDNIREKISAESNRTTTRVSDSDNSQISVLDDIFGKPETGDKATRKPAPSKGRMAKELAVKHSSNLKTSKIDDGHSDKQGARFKDVNEIFCSTSADSDSDVKLEISTLKDDDYDCFDDPRKWKKRKRKPDKEPVSAVDKLISDSEAEFDKLFTAGKMKKNDVNKKKEKESSSAKSFDGSASLFSI
ncbi:MAG: hypothetical protein AB2693_33345, partial [Candidatus Thiodiazotropha sp.]